MSQIRISSLSLGLLLSLFVFALSGCGDKNSQATFDAATGKHVNDATWKVAGHKSAVVDATSKLSAAKAEACKECHGTDFKGGASKVNCTTQCHMDSIDKVHFTAWNDLTYTKHKDTIDTSKCANASCHAANYLGVTGSGPSCTSCHVGDATHKHPAAWGPVRAFLFYSTHAGYVRSGGINVATAKCSNTACHALDLKGNASATNTRATGPSCSGCHIGNAVNVHPIVANWRGDAPAVLQPIHSTYTNTTSAITNANRKAKCDIEACHGSSRVTGGGIKTSKAAAYCQGCHPGQTF